jgi:4-hydroxybenzoate polyprenyltransferase
MSSFLESPIYLYNIRHLHFGHVAVAVIAILFMLIPVVGSTGIPGSSLFPVPGKPYNVFPFLFLMYLVVGGGWFLMLRLHSPEVIEDMERDIEAIHTKFSDMKKV